MKKILVPLHRGYGRALKGLGEITGDVDNFLSSPKDFSLVLFTGGEDVTPALYGETSPGGVCHYNPNRDAYEAGIFNVALENNIKITGICRGSQFANVMSGGKMIHHLDNHAGGEHLVETSKGEVISTNTLHHQMSIPPEDGFVIGWSKERKSNSYLGNGDEPVNYVGLETEIVLIPRTNYVGVQWHPEMMPERTDGYLYYWEMIDRFLRKGVEGLVSEYVKVAQGAK